MADINSQTNVPGEFTTPVYQPVHIAYTGNTHPQDPSENKRIIFLLERILDELATIRMRIK